jgi:hypothetical protein
MSDLTIKQVEDKIKELYLLEDEGIIRIILATVLGNKLGLSDKPIWLLLLAGSSSGKTALMSIIDKCGSWVVPIDTLTTNTFASGLSRDEEVSLLWKANNGVLTFKDFTTITNMNDEGLREIMGQLRAIYDGEFTKRTGNANDVEWRGKIGIIAGGTIASQRKMRQFSEQGERFINYVMNVADSKDITKKAMDNQKNLSVKADEVAELVSEFINGKLNSVTDELLTIPEEIRDAMIDVADFATKARSPVTMSKKDPTMVEFVGDREMPPRMAMMLVNIAMALMIIADEKKLSDLNARILYKTALDSVPVERRIVLNVLAQYREATTKALAQKLNYPTNTIRAWCNQLNALQMTTRTGGTGGPKGDTWTLKDEYKEVMCKYEGIKEIDETLIEHDDEDEQYAKGNYTGYMEEEDMTEDQLLANTDTEFNKLFGQMKEMKEESL